MRTMSPGAARRRETTEAVRDRMTNLFEVPDDGFDPPRRSTARTSAAPPPAPPPPPPGDPGPDHEPDAPLAAAPGWRHALMLPPGLALDRRAFIGLAVLLLFAVGYAVQHFWLGRPQPVTIPAVSRGSASPIGQPAPAASPSKLVVDVAGKVQHPGLRTLPSGARVADALSAAGGPLPETDTDGLNLARMLTDGEQIVVGAPVPVVQGSTPRGPVSLNHATIEQLDTLPGVGPALAQRILTFRQDHGGFRSLDQLRQVSGIGDRKFLDLKALLTL